MLICGTGAGMCIAANKFRGIRAVACRTTRDAKDSRIHNDSNVLCLGATYTATEEAEETIRAWLSTPFDDSERRIRRLDKLSKIEKHNFRETVIAPKKGK